MKIFTQFIVACLISQVMVAQPVIISFSPTSGTVGTTVTITGTNFGANPADNIVYFGATKAAVTAASPTSLIVTVPVGATYEPLTVTTNGLTAYASKPFTVTFEGGNKPFTESSFATEPGIKTGNPYEWATPFGITIGDYDGDGKADLAATITWFDTVEVYRNISVKGGIIFAEKIKLPVELDRFSSNRIHIYSSDIDGDEKLDLIATNEGNSDYNLYHGGVSIFRNNSTIGTLSFEPEKYYKYFLSRTQGVGIADFNGDGKPDLAVLNAGGDPPYAPWDISIQKNTSTPGNIAYARPYKIFIGEEERYVNPISIVSRDFDGDHKPDLAWVDSRLNKLYIARNISTPDSIMFADKIEYATALSPYYITAADIDNDNKQDIVIANNGTATVSVFKNISAGDNIAFAEKQEFVVSAAANGLAITDLNGDGMPDIAAATDNNPYSISLLQNKSSIGVIDFTTNTDYDVAGSSLYICNGDLDGDGKPDIAATRQGVDTISILRNLITATTTCNPPTALNVAKIRDTAVLLKWTLPTEPVSSFKIRYRAVGSTELIKRNIKANSNHVVLCGLLPNTTYQWQIRSNCATDTSAWVRGPNFTTASTFATTFDINNILANNNIHIAPNPSKGNFVLQLQLPSSIAITTLQLYNSSGQKVWQENLGNISGTIVKNIFLENKLPAGYYLLKIERKDTSFRQKVVITK